MRTDIKVDKDPGKELRAGKNSVWVFLLKLRKPKPRKVNGLVGVTQRVSGCTGLRFRLS